MTGGAGSADGSAGKARPARKPRAPSLGRDGRPAGEEGVVPTEAQVCGEGYEAPAPPGASASGTGIVSGLLEPVAMTEAEFDAFRAFVADLCGIHLHSGKKALVQARLHGRIRSLGLSSLGDYLAYVQRSGNSEELTAMLDALSTNLTSFFREPDHLEYLRATVLTRLIDARGEQARKIRIWSAGCSTGEEAYSIAMQILERIPEPIGWDVKILGTDISVRALAHAKDGVYDEDRLRGLPPGMAAKYLTAVKGSPPRRLQVRRQVRDLVHFARLNLKGVWPMKGPFHVVFCRNVLIYFDKTTQESIVGRVHDLLAPGGVLCIGHSESLMGIPHRFRYVRPSLYEKP